MSVTPAPGFVLRDPDRRFGASVARIIVAVIGVMVVIGLVVRAGWILFTLLLLVVGAGVLLARDRLTGMMRWHPPQLEMLPSYDLGSTARVVYHRKAKRPTDVGTCALEGRIICQETVTYTNGSDTTTKRSTVFEVSAVGSGEGTVDGLRADVELPISAHAGAPSFALPSNKVRWYVEVRVRGPRLPSDSRTFTVQVAPRLDSSLRPGLQDS